MLTIKPIDDPEFRAYGKVLGGYDTTELMEAASKIPLPENGVAYEAAIPSLEACAVMKDLEAHAYAGQPIEIGMCWGMNTKLNCLEYHRDTELNIGTGEYVLLVAKMEEIGDDGMLDTSKVKAFRVPAGVVLQVYETTLHYAPCQAAAGEGFRVAIVLPRGTNVGGTGKPDFEPFNDEDRRLWSRNKWILAHPDTAEAAQGAYIGLKGENIDIAGLL